MAGEKKKTYRVWAKVTSYCYLDVEASSEDEAFAIADDTDGGDFIPCDDGEFEVMPDPEEL